MRLSSGWGEAVGGGVGGVGGEWGQREGHGFGLGLLHMR